MSKPAPTKTTNPIHFEDLDPGRFEDLVRELIYDFRDWHNIEATGKGGSDDGFDIRAYERATATTIDEDGNEILRPMDGNIWMIQCKREKAVPPSKIKKILSDVDAENPPYGYILVAPANFSKKAYDTFREELTSLGVMEFHLWGKAALETELYQPKNDRILFTFFGISNVRRKRSRGSEIRSEVVNKNKVMRMLGDHPAHSWILVRDSDDRFYPYEGNYPDFEQNPRWQSYEVVELHPRGIIVVLEKRYAYVDTEEECFDLAEPAIMLRNPRDRHHDPDEDRNERHQQSLVRDYWERLPQRNQAMYQLNGIIRYKDMLVIDDKGDAWNDTPHIYTEFINGSPVSGTSDFFEGEHRGIDLDQFSKNKIFPSSFPEPQFGEIHDRDGLALPERLAQRYANFHGNELTALYDVDGRFAHLRPGDVAVVRCQGKEDRFVQITHRYTTSVDELLRAEPQSDWKIKQQLEQDLNRDQSIEVFEIRSCYRHQWEDPR